jgi:putative drug exporter of the RND superfamily
VLNTIARWATKHPKRVLLVFLALFILLGAAGGGVFPKLKGGGFDDPKSPSSREVKILERNFGTGEANIVAVVTAANGRGANNPQVAAAGLALTHRIAAVPGVAASNTFSYWTTGSRALLSANGQRGLVLARAVGDEDAVAKTMKRVHTALKDVPPGVTVGLSGQAEFFSQLSTTIEKDLGAAEGLALPITLVLLIVVFAGWRAASLPLAVGIFSIFGAFGVLFVLTLLTNVSIFSINLVTALGLGLAVDYSLFIVSRFREELGKGFSVDDAVRTTVRHAGRAIAFSGLTVAVSLSALLIFPLYFLRSFAYAGVAVIGVALLTSVVLVPALLKLMGERLTPKPKIRHLGRQADDNFWGRLAHKVMRRPVPVILGVGAVLLFAGSPFLGIKFGQPDDRVLAPHTPVRNVSDILRKEFANSDSNAFQIVSTGAVAPAAASQYAAAVSAVSGVLRVDAFDATYAGGVRVGPPDPGSAPTVANGRTWFNVVPKVEPISKQAETMITDIRAVNRGFPTAVGGASAALVDSKHATFSKIPLAGLLVALTTFVLLFLMFGSVLVPLKAIFLNILSLTATFGAMVWIFQSGHGSGLLNFTATGLTDTSEPILMFCIAFGLSMDYEVFLLSRIKEEYDRTGDNEHAVAAGLARTGRIVTAAALILSVTFFAFATSHVTFIQLFGVGLGVAMLADAFIIRAALVPALMKLAGRANWWAPRPLAALQRRFALNETVAEPVSVPAAVRWPAPLVHGGNGGVSHPAGSALDVSLGHVVSASNGNHDD